MERGEGTTRRREMDLRSVQKPLKEKYREDPEASKITLSAKASQQDAPISCSALWRPARR
jgi:hypothetical protein